MVEPAPAQSPDTLTGGQWLAGALLFLKGFISVGERLILPEAVLFRLSGLGGPVVIMDMLLGAVLLAGKRRVVDLAMWKLGLELVLTTNARLQQGELLLAGARVAVCLGLLLLLFRRAGPTRIAVGALLFAAFLVVEGLAIAEAVRFVTD